MHLMSITVKYYKCIYILYVINRSILQNKTAHEIRPN